MKWCEKNVLPHIDSFWRLLSELFMSLWRSSLGVRSWCNTNVQATLILVDQYFPVYAAKVITAVNNIILLLSSQLKVAFAYVWQYGQTAVVWLQSNAYVANSMEIVRNQIINLSGFLQGHVVSLVNFIYSHIPSLV
ncbi:uncharacterized protein LOC129233054 [Uloborus diversus]|nr:uncharacterized protein LOC129233054 [Uloborus diversus]